MQAISLDQRWDSMTKTHGQFLTSKECHLYNTITIIIIIILWFCNANEVVIIHEMI
jgi:hypothetical protein